MVSSSLEHEKRKTSYKVYAKIQDLMEMQQQTLEKIAKNLSSKGLECSLWQGFLSVTKNKEWSFSVSGNWVTGDWIVRIRGDWENKDLLGTLDTLKGDFPLLTIPIGVEILRCQNRGWRGSAPGAKKEKKSLEGEFTSSEPVFGDKESGKRKKGGLKK